MRWLAVYSAVSLLFLAGCSTGPSPDAQATSSAGSSGFAPLVSVTILSGTVRETGPEYEYHGGVCGRVRNSIQMQDGELWYVLTGNPVRPGADLLVWSQVDIRMMHGPGGCGSDGVLFGKTGEHEYTVQIEDQADRRLIRREAGAIRFGNELLQTGASGNWTFHATLDHSPMAEGSRGNYSYDGTLTLTYLGDWPATRIHAVDDCMDLPRGC